MCTFTLDHPNYILTSLDLKKNQRLCNKYIGKLLGNRYMEFKKAYIVWDPFMHTYPLCEKSKMLNTIKQVFNTFEGMIEFKTITEILQRSDKMLSINQIDNWFLEIDESDYIIILDHSWIIDLLITYASHIDKPIFMMTGRDVI